MTSTDAIVVSAGISAAGQGKVLEMRACGGEE